MLFLRKSGYLPLFSSSKTPSDPRIAANNRRWILTRILRILPVLAVFAVGAWWYFKYYRHYEPYPPLYEDYRHREDNLPHYSPDTPSPDGRHAKYIYSADHNWGLGWGNIMQNLILNGLLAYTVKRSFVFYNYEWDWNPSVKFSDYNGHLIPSTIPLTAMISGPLVGGDMGTTDVPRAVSKNHYFQVCQNRTILQIADVNKNLQGGSVLKILDTWVEKIEAMEDRCIEIAPAPTGAVFDYMLFGSKDVLDIWPVLSRSPMITKFDWSPLIHSAFVSNRRLFGPSSSIDPTAEDPSPLLYRIPGLLVVHLRRGDFATHCDHLARWSSAWNGFNQFEGLPDKFEVPSGGGWGENTPENMAIYRKHCYPDLSQIAEKVSSVRRKVPGLNRLYIMTNGKREWINELTRELHQSSDKWQAITSSRDLSLTWDQKYVAHALDMLVAQRAQAYIGNGWSSLTSNTVMLRIAGKHEPDTTFFW